LDVLLSPHQQCQSNRETVKRPSDEDDAKSCQRHTTHAVMTCRSARTTGATTFSKLGGPILGLGYCTEQNTDGIPSFVHCSLQLRKKLGWSVQIFGGLDPLTPQWLRPWLVPRQHRVEQFLGTSFLLQVVSRALLYE